MAGEGRVLCGARRCSRPPQQPARRCPLVRAPLQVRGARGARLLALAYGSLGVIYGDIGTSPLYAFSRCVACSFVCSSHPQCAPTLAHALHPTMHLPAQPPPALAYPSRPPPSTPPRQHLP